MGSPCSQLESLLKRHENDPLLKRIITGGKKWVVYNNVKRKRSWSKKDEPAQTISKADIHTKKSDEAHFWLNGYVNKQNCRIWSEANPQVYVETPLHPEKLTVWCALWAGGIICPYFFKNDEGQIGLHPSQPWQSYARNHI
ncbi:uncharacterized protein TNCV_306211 [Trichonephila clavipes]|nr:uncharacterized protein TNCV_306211 [Trichonephila clavipes]